jgi:hypothetical protein
MRQAEFQGSVESENICASIAKALDRAKLLLPLMGASLTTA